MSKKPKLTDKVQYSDEAKNALSDQEILIINALADKEPSCYADIAAIIIELYAKKEDQLKRCKKALEEVASGYWTQEIKIYTVEDANDLIDEIE